MKKNVPLIDSKKEQTVDNLANLEALIQRVKIAQQQFAEYTQEQVDVIFKAVATAVNKARIALAQMAVEETKMGIVEDKVIKNHFASEYIYNKYKDTKTCDLIRTDKNNGVKVIAKPLGIIAGIIPTTNPTSTIIFKALIALKTRNAIIFSPHPRAKKSTIAAAKIVLEAAIAAGAPKDIIGWIDTPSLELSNALLQHGDIACILATGGPGMVKAAYSSGKPALGVGPGNVPAIVDETAEIKMVASSILLSKTFDHGMICASEQAVVVVQEVYEELKAELKYRGAYFLNDQEKTQLNQVLFTKEGTLNPMIVGQSAEVIAQLANLNVPKDTKILVGETEAVTSDNPLAHEKLSPVLAFYRAQNYEAAVEIAHQLILIGGAGHSAVLYTNAHNEQRINYFANKIPACRLLVNSPSSQGGIGDLYNFKLAPSLTLGCGSWGGNSISENVGVKHLLNYKTVAERRENMLWFRVPSKIYFKRGATEFALRELAGKKRAFIVTDNYLFSSGVLNNVTNVLREINVDYQVFFDVKPDPTLSTIYQALKVINAYQPDVIIAVGGGSPMDAAKIIWLMYEQPHTKFEDLSMRFMDIRKRICSIPELGKKAYMVAIPTTSGTGSEVTPFSIITDDQTHVKYAIADYALTPNMAIIDPNFVDHLPKALTAASGIDALVHALEAYVSVLATDFTNAGALEAMQLIFKYLPRAYRYGAEDLEAREEVHYAATIAGISFANAFLGLCHSMAHKLGAMYNIPHGVANALLINQVIRFNASERPRKQAIFPQYKYPNIKERYSQVADHLGLVGKDQDQKITALLKAITELKEVLELPRSIQDFGVDEKEFFANLDHLVELAFDDQCTGSNPAYPLMSEIKQIYTDAFYGVNS